MFACRACWFDLPHDVRQDIGRAYRQHGALSEEWCAAAARAFAAWGMEKPNWLVVAMET